MPAAARPGRRVALLVAVTALAAGTACDGGGRDTTPPGAPVFTTSFPDAASADDRPVLAGTAEPRATVRIYTSPDCSGAPSASAGADAAGVFSTPVTVPHDMATVFSATAVDAAGNVSRCASGPRYLHDGQPPPPTLTVSPNGPANDNWPVVSGAAERGATVEVYADPLCSGPPLASEPIPVGTFRASVHVADDSTTTFHGVVTDPTGHRSECGPGITYVEDSLGPAAPELSLAPASPSTVATLTASGSTEPGASVTVHASADCTGAAAAEVTADASGAFSAQVNAAQDATTWFSARARDRAGNLSACSSGRSFVHDGTPPSFAGISAAIATGPGTVRLTWPAASDATTAPADITYEICRTDAWHGCDAFVASDTVTGATSFDVTGLTPDARSFFAVRARDALGHRDANLRQAMARLPGPAGQRSVTVGQEFTCVLGDGGTVQCAGVNTSGQLGDGTTSSRPTFAPVAGVAGAISLDAGFEHACAVLVDGTVRCWGRNAEGQLGVGDRLARTSPAVVPGLHGAVAVTSGARHTCALLSSGAVRCWGDNGYGQLGDGSTSTAASPVAVSGLDTVVSLSAGGMHTCAVRAAGTAVCWGSDDYGQIGDGAMAYGIRRLTPAAVIGSGFVSVSAGGAFTCAAREDGSVRCWGLNGSGQLGDGTTTSSPSPVTPEVRGVVAIACGSGHTCALRGNGEAWCWGDDSYQQLGALSSTTSPVPVLLTSPAPSIALAAGFTHTCAVGADGVARCLGRNTVGQLGDGTTTLRSSPSPAAIASANAARQLSVAGDSACATLTAGQIVCFGANDRGQAGSASSEGVPLPVEVPGLAARAVAVGGATSCAVRPDGDVACWGDNAHGQLGPSVTSSSNSAPAVIGISGGVAAVAVGTGHVCALAGGLVSCWGDNASGQLGDGSFVSRSTPALVQNLASVRRIALGAAFSCALRSDGVVLCWGRGAEHQLGRYSPTGESTPVQSYAGVVPAIDLAASAENACAITAGGGVSCWGSNTRGQLGNGTTTPFSLAVSVTGVDDAIDVSVGGAHACVVRAGGTVACWGAGTEGQLGDGALQDSPLHVAVSGVTTAVSVHAGARHTCALLADGSGVCWGDDASGQLGSGLTGIGRATPAPIEAFP
ncbi:RCC1 domain-containing protein [Anaeromyxobacter terrae]|uniref:RCC1 domain-containing protein n=1 Tax=Anaeromyxobacter terrae TaxID=2925406 RepID=UPI001F5744E3|nr:Ig-like domain-containing protein [Anaeromyxobacter sp. SG22]